MNTPNFTPETEKVMRRIQRLLQIANRSTGNDGASNEAEATQAMAMAQKLLAAHNLEYALVNEANLGTGTSVAKEEKREKVRISRSAQYRWQRELWKALAEANFCWHSVVEVYEGKRGTKSTTSKIPVKRHMIIGRESNVMVVRMMGEYLEDTMERLITSVGGFTNRERLGRSAISWKSGCAGRLVERIEEQAEQRKAEGDAGTGAKVTGTGLVLRDVYQKEYAANYDVWFGTGAFNRRQIEDAEWKAGAETREAARVAEREKAERDWLEYLQNESPAQKKAREREEAKERIQQAKANARAYRKWDNERWREASKVDREAFDQGNSAGHSISLDGQISEVGRKERALH